MEDSPSKRDYGIIPAENRYQSTLLARKKGGTEPTLPGAPTAAGKGVNAFSRNGAAGASVHEGGTRRQRGPFRAPGIPAAVDVRDRPSTEPHA
jgi:hypothetical protein